MRRRKSNYELASSQVATPPAVVDLFWRVVRTHRHKKLESVVEVGAGDARFYRGGYFDRYLGVEIDPKVAKTARVGANSEIRVGCAFSMAESGFDACIGNPPYVRHHDVSSPWKEKTLAMLSESLHTRLDGHGNLYLYFLALGLIKTHDSGLVALIVPYEWVSRPSANGIRQVLESQNWGVTVYRFKGPIFPGVLTTASISVIDKADRSAKWRYFDISDDFAITPAYGKAPGDRQVIEHSVRSSLYAQRGLSAGSQKIFTLTEGERIHHGLKVSDVAPCVTSLRHVPSSVNNLSHDAFRIHFIEAGARCWLIRSNRPRLTARLRAYLDGVPAEARATWTCQTQSPWYNYERPTVPPLLLHSGFTSHGPKILLNDVGAVNVGSVYGVFVPRVAAKRLQTYLRSCDIESQVVPHAKTLKKLEVGQVNTLLEDWWHVTRPN